MGLYFPLVDLQDCFWLTDISFIIYNTVFIGELAMKFL